MGISNDFERPIKRTHSSSASCMSPKCVLKGFSLFYLAFDAFI